MAFKIGLFSLKSGVGCTSLAIHIANFLSTLDKVAFIEKTGKGEDPELHRVKTGIDNDGTFNVENVHFYPELKIEDENSYPLEYKPLNLPVGEYYQVYDFGSINFMFDFPEQIDKFYLITDDSEQSILEIQSFYNELRTQGTLIDFDVIVTGASRDVMNLFKEKLPYVKSVIAVSNEKEQHIDYMLSLKLQVFMRSVGEQVPTYSDKDYESIEFYSKDDWIELWKSKNFSKKESKKKNPFFRNEKKKEPKKETKKEKTKDIQPDVVVKKSDINVSKKAEEIKKVEETKTKVKAEKRKKKETVQTSQALEPNVFDAYMEFESVPAPTYEQDNQSEIAEDIKEYNDNVENKDVKENRIMSVRPAPVIDGPVEIATLDEDEKAEIIKVAESFEPEKINDDVSGEYKEHIVYEHKEEESGLLGELIEGINRGGHFCCNVFIVTKSAQLFVFSSVDTFFEKLDALKGEIRDTKNIHYAILTFNNEERRPRIFTKDRKIQMSTYAQSLALLDSDLRTKRNFSGKDIKNHRELAIYDEVIYAS